VNLSEAEVAVVPPAVVTVTSTVPAAATGVTAEIRVSDWTLKLAAAVVPKLTALVVLQNPEPVIDTVVPPAVVPWFGVTPVTVGVEATYPYEVQPTSNPLNGKLREGARIAIARTAAIASTGTTVLNVALLTIDPPMTAGLPR
jgi:hypothetical protein